VTSRSIGDVLSTKILMVSVGQRNDLQNSDYVGGFIYRTIITKGQVRYRLRGRTCILLEKARRVGSYNRQMSSGSMEMKLWVKDFGDVSFEDFCDVSFNR